MGGGLNWAPMMLRDDSLSDSCTPDRGRFCIEEATDDPDHLHQQLGRAQWIINMFSRACVLLFYN